jgi:hypothetical protein
MTGKLMGVPSTVVASLRSVTWRKKRGRFSPLHLLATPLREGLSMLFRGRARVGIVRYNLAAAGGRFSRWCWGSAAQALLGNMCGLALCELSPYSKAAKDCYAQSAPHGFLVTGAACAVEGTAGEPEALQREHRAL